MPEPVLLPYRQVIRLVAQANMREFALFLGAGASKSSGVPLASEMIAEWRQTLFQESAPAGADCDAWCKSQEWYNADNEYSLLFEMLYPYPRARQAYVEEKIRHAFPRWGYLYLANVIVKGYFNIIFTTNFDDLVNDALTIYLSYNPVVCAADSQVIDLRITTDRAKIIKLHGDFLFERLKNTVEELDQLDPNMSAKFKQFAKECGIVVIGYAGYDRSVMRVFEELLKDDQAFPNGVYWGIRSPQSIAPRVQALAQQYGKRFQLFKCPDFDIFMAGLNDELKCPLPQTILLPYQAVKKLYDPLVEMATDNELKDLTIRKHIDQLRIELNRDVAKATDVSDLDLLQAQAALGRREYKSALELIAKYDRQRPNDPTALTAWGDALAIQAEMEDSDSIAEQAVVKWKQAIQQNPKVLPPRYSLERYYAQKQKFAEAIQSCEELLPLLPNDKMVQRELALLYNAAGRYDDALRQVDALLARNPQAADLHAWRATVLEQKGLPEESLKEIHRAVELNPTSAALHFALGNSLARVTKWKEAGEQLEQAIHLDQKNVAYRLQIVAFYSSLARLDLALPHCQEAVRLQPDSAEAHGWLGQIYFGLQNLTGAEIEIETALRLSPQDSRLHANAGVLYASLNRPDVAEAHFQKAIELNPAASQPYYGLCLIYWMQGRQSEFATVFQQLQQLWPQVADALSMQLQAIQMQQTNWQAALQQQFAPQQPPLPRPGDSSQPQSNKAKTRYDMQYSPIRNLRG